MATILALAVLIAAFALLVHLTRNDTFSGPAPLDRFRDSDVWLFRDVNRYPR